MDQYISKDFADGPSVDAALKKALNSAPSGYGLGAYSKKLSSNDDLDKIMLSGWYYFETSSLPQNAPTYFSRSLMRVDGLSNGIFRQTLYFANAASLKNSGSVLVRSVYNYSGSDWEWVNPPRLLGVEYRTTERYLGSVVYAQIVNFGYLPNATTKSVKHGIADVRHVISVDISQENGTNCFSGGLVYRVNSTDIVITSSSDASSAIANVLIKYTKTTN